ncbi:MAG: glycosyl hydrolase family 28 protein [Clostridia bacterium]|nr:glycosyl hydrolase family 28 protein [Clostridia bacterium]
MKDDTARLQAMLDGESRDIFIPEGCYTISKPLKIHDNTHLKLSNSAVIRLADNGGCFMLENDRCEKEGFNHRITVEGGIWDGNNEHQPKRGVRGDQRPYFIGHIMRFDGVLDFTLKNVTFKDPSAYAMQILNADRFTVENITFDYNLINPNMDGVHIQGPAKNGVIRNIKGATNDDLVALNCNDAFQDWEPESISSGDIENIMIDGLFAENGYTGVRLLSCGNQLRNISIRNIFGTYRFYGASFTHHNVIPGAKVWIDHVDISNVYCSKPPQTEPLDTRPIECIDKSYGKGVHANAVKHEPIIWFAKGVCCGSISISNLHRREESQTQAPAIRIDETAVIERLALDNIAQHFTACPPAPLIVNNGTVKELIGTHQSPSL